MFLALKKSPKNFFFRTNEPPSEWDTALNLVRWNKLLFVKKKEKRKKSGMSKSKQILLPMSSPSSSLLYSLTANAYITPSHNLTMQGKLIKKIAGKAEIPFCPLGLVRWVEGDQ